MKSKLALCLVVIVAVAFMPASAFADSGGKTVKMKVYDDIYKSGNTIYVAAHSGLYKVKVKKGKVKKVKRLFTRSWHYDLHGMKKKNNYLYFQGAIGAVSLSNLYRIKLSGGKAKELDSCRYYAIKGKKIYCYQDENEDDVRKWVMKLNGKGKKRTSTSARSIARKTNKKGYRVIVKEKGDYTCDYLKTPKGTYYLGKYIFTP